MTIRTKEADVPSEFPPARLFLDDIEEIVRILVDATEERENLLTHKNDAKATLTLTIKDQVCDEVQELPRIATKTFDLSIRVEIQDSLPETYLSFDRDSTQLHSPGFTREEKLSNYHKLAPIFKRRNLWWATLIHSRSGWYVFIFGATLAVLYALLFLWVSVLIPSPDESSLTSYLSRHEMIHWSLRAATLISITLAIALWARRRRHSVIILRHSSEPSPVRQGLRDKLPATLIGAALGSVLTFLLTLLGLYLKHKYWP